MAPSRSPKVTPEMAGSTRIPSAQHVSRFSGLNSLDNYVVNNVGDITAWGGPLTPVKISGTKDAKNFPSFLVRLKRCFICDKSECKAKSATTYHAFSPLWIIMGIVGLFPIRLKAPHTPCSHLWKSTILYSMAVYSWIMYSSAWRFIQDRIPILDPHNNSATLDDRLYSLFLTVHVSTLLFVPIMWVDYRHVDRKIQSMDNYMRDFERVANESLYLCQLRWRNLVTKVVMVVWLPLVTKAFELLPHQTFFLPEYLAAFVYAAYVQINTTTDRIMIALLLQHLAQAQARHFQLVCSREPSPRLEDLRQVRRLWIHLRQVYHQSCDSFNVELLKGINLFILLTLSLYQFLAFMFALSFYEAAAQIMMTFVYTCELLLICVSSQKAMDEMKDPFINILDQLSLSTDKEIQEEVKLFLATMSIKPASLKLANFINIDRSLFAKIFSSIITYLVVLVQFRNADEENLSCATEKPSI